MILESYHMNENIRKLKGANMDIDLAATREAFPGSRIIVPGTEPRAQIFTDAR